jgi:mRNA-degrading endonuclease HigB of HigAB toxin-antitoxin module
MQIKEFVKEVYLILYPQDIIHSDKLNSTINVIKSKKFPLPKEIEDIEFPKNVSNLTDNELVNLMEIYCRLIEYTGFEVAKFSIEETNAKNTYEWEKSKRKVTLHSMKKKKTEIDLYLEADEKLRALYECYEYYNSLFTLSKSLLSGYRQNYKSLSRNLSERLSHKERKY